MGSKIRIDGIKLSRELIHITVSSGPEKEDFNTRLLRSMAENRINCPILFYSAMDRCSRGAVCVAAEDSHRLHHLLALDPELKEKVQYISPVGAISLFPHKFSLNLLGCLMHVSGKTGLPVYGLAASLSALTLTTDFHRLDGVIESLMPYISLPPNHAPFRPQLRVNPIVA
jgi:hypothetical protein